MSPTVVIRIIHYYTAVFFILIDGSVFNRYTRGKKKYDEEIFHFLCIASKISIVAATRKDRIVIIDKTNRVLNSARNEAIKVPTKQRQIRKYLINRISDNF